AENPGIEFKLELDRERYLAQRNNLVYLKASVIAKGHSELSRRQPVNLAFVVDRSGSMAGEPIQYLKKGLVEALDRLDKEDLVTVIAFGSEAETLFPSQQLDQIKNRNLLIQQIEAEGGAAPFEALNFAAAQLRRNLSSTPYNRILFMTDGPATNGPREDEDFLRLIDSLAREGITVSTIGYGESFSEDLLREMATKGAGDYHFANSGDSLIEAFSQEIMRMNQVVARDLNIEIRFAGGIRAEEIFGRTGELNRDTVKLSLGQLLNGENKYVLVTANVPARLSFLESIKVAEATLTYLPVGDANTVEAIIAQEVRAGFTSYLPAVTDSINHDVAFSVISHEIAESMEIAIAFADEGNLDKALRELKGTLRDAKNLNLDLEDPAIDALIEDLENFIADMESRGLNRIDRKVMTLRVFQAIKQRSLGSSQEKSEIANPSEQP
ncbi:MAG: VWA domain-containing protein, partial [Verrucomicrobiae bacterium]|nr:VWA domain-containing protein [Verrucomicrobiae bacterium]